MRIPLFDPFPMILLFPVSWYVEEMLEKRKRQEEEELTNYVRHSLNKVMGSIYKEHPLGEKPGLHGASYQ